jgi:hypothetical protein
VPAEQTTGEALAAELVTTERVQRVVSTLEQQGNPVTFDAVYERVLESTFRETRPSRFAGDLDLRAFRSAAAAATRREL